MKEQCRDVGAARWLEELMQDVRYGLRQLRRNPGFTSISILTLALGICASAAIFSFVNAALLRPLPFPHPNRLVAVTETVPGLGPANLSYPDYLDWKKLNRVFSSLNVWAPANFLIGAPGGAQPVRGLRVSAGFFRTLGIQPVLGRGFHAGEDAVGAPRTVLLTYGAWRKWFGGRKNIIGQTAMLSDDPFTVIGVLPRDFRFAPSGGAQFWIALQASDSCERRRSCHGLYGVARLKPGITVAAARADMVSIATQLQKRYPDSNRGQGASVLPLAATIVGPIRPVLLTLLGAALLLLLIAYINVAGLLLLRSEGRRREIAVRGALGASPGRMVRQFITEGLLLVIAATGLGLLAAALVIPRLGGLIPAPMHAAMPYFGSIGLSLRALEFAAAIAVAAAVLFGLIPVCQLSLTKMRDGLAASARASSGMVWKRLGSNLVVVELAIALVLLSGAGLLGTSLYRLLQVGLGFDPSHLATMEIAAPGARYGIEAQQIRLGREILAAVSALPGVRSAAITTRQLPVSFNGNTDWVRFPGRPYNGVHNEVNERDVSASYFTTLQAPLRRGRFFSRGEDESQPRVAIINEAFAKKYFPGQNPLGQQMGDTKLLPQSLKEIVGVVANIREGALNQPTWPTLYLPFNQSPDTFMGILVRTAQAPLALLPALDATMRRIDPGIGIASQSTMRDRIADSGAAFLHRSAAFLVGGFAGLALLLGVVGVYGVVAYSASQRTHEVGIRMALGAPRASVHGLILGQAARLIGAGVVLGLLGSLAAARLIRALLFGTAGANPAVLAAVSVLLAACGLLACYLPARRAAKTDPMLALRHE